MPTVSVKLSDATRERVQALARSRGMTAHALMVDAIEDALANAQIEESFIRKALQAREHLAQTGLVMEPQAFGEYLQSKIQGKPRRRPLALGLNKALKARR